jgi:hypothetical protein
MVFSEQGVAMFTPLNAQAYLTRVLQCSEKGKERKTVKKSQKPT